MLELVTTAIALGLLSSAHCIGMCGPLALAVPAVGGSNAQRWAGTVVLNGGRVITYMLLGTLFGLFGKGLQLAGLQQVVSITLGVLILGGLLLPRLFRHIDLGARAGGLVIRLQGIMARQVKRTSWEGLFFTGMLNGLLPCGMVYLAAAGALAQVDAWHGALFMGLFGLGTWPALFAIRITGSSLGPQGRNRLRKLVPYAYALMGLLFILRGLDLGIPYLSPDLPEANTTVQECAPHEAP